MIRALLATLLHPVFHARDVLERVAGQVTHLTTVIRETTEPTRVMDQGAEVGIERALRVDLPAEVLGTLDLNAEAFQVIAESVQRATDRSEGGTLVASLVRGANALDRIAAALEARNERDEKNAATCWACPVWKDGEGGGGYWQCASVPPGGRCPRCKAAHPYAPPPPDTNGARAVVSIDKVTEGGSR